MGTGRFAGKTVVITGGGGNIGLAVAKRLADEGARIALLDVDKGKLDQAVSELEQQHARVTPFVCDVTDIPQVTSVGEQVKETCGQIDFLFNNAGYQGAFTATHHFPNDDFNRVIQINVIGVFNVLKAFSQHMVSHGHGVIVNTASMAGVDGAPNMLAYSTSKAAVIGMTRSAAKDLAPYGIRVNAISPGFIGPGFMWDRQVELQAAADSQYYSSEPEQVATEMLNSTPMRRYGSLEEIAGTVAYLFSSDSGYVTGTNIPIAGGANH